MGNLENTGSAQLYFYTHAGLRFSVAAITQITSIWCSSRRVLTRRPLNSRCQQGAGHLMENRSHTAHMAFLSGI